MSFGFGSNTATAGFGFPTSTTTAGTNSTPLGTTLFSGGTPYSALPPDLKQAIDTIHESIMKHKRTMLSLQNMAPKALLEIREDPLKIGAGQDQAKHIAPLAVSIQQLHQNIATLEQETGLQKLADNCKDEYEILLKQAYMHGSFQIENLAARRGIHLKQQQSTHQTDGKGNMIQALLDGELRHVDRLEKMPSPYFWAIVEDLERRLQNLKHNALTVQQQIISSNREDHADIPSLVQSQHRALYRVSSRLDLLSQQVSSLRQQYSFYEKGENVLEKAQFEEQQRNQRLHNRIQLQYVQAAASSTQAGAPAVAISATTLGTFGTTPVGSTTPAPAFGTTPAPSFGAVGSTPAPALGSFGAFGSTPAPTTTATTATSTAPATNLFGSASAPSSAFSFGAFGSTSAAPPTFGAASSTSSSTPKSSSKNKSRSKSRGAR